MTTAYITEYANVVNEQGVMPVPQEPALVDQTPVSFTTSTAGATFNAQTKYVRIMVDGDAHVQFAVSPTATTSMQKLTAEVEYFRGVGPNSGLTAAFIDAV